MGEPTEHCPDCGTPMTTSVAGMCPRCLLTDTWSDDTNPANETEAERAFPLDYLRPLFPNLQIEELIAHGGMGSAYLVTQKALNRKACLKVLSPALANNPEFVERFRQEAEVIGKLDDPNIVTVFDASEVDNVLYILMEFVDGQNLKQFATADPPSPATVIELLQQVCSGLAVAHRHNIVHRDIKPANILIQSDTGQAKLSDFGLAKLEQSSPYGGLTSVNLTLGTPRYMAPEQWENPGAVDKWSDVYSVGVVFYELATGLRPTGHFAPPSKVTANAFSSAYDELICKALSSKPEDRFQDAEEMYQAALRLSKKPASPKKRLAIIGVSIAALVVGAVVSIATNDPDTKTDRLPIAGGSNAPAPAPDSHGWRRTYAAKAEFFKTNEPRSSLGRSLAIVEDIVIAGAPQGGLKGIDIAGSGFAMVQRTENDQATLQMEFARSAPQTITGDADTGDLFGYEVAASSIGQRNYVIIGSPGRSQAVGKEPENWGRALVYFEAADDSWNLEQDLSCENYASLNPPVFGHAVAASGQSVAVGAPAFKATESSELGAVGTYQLGSDGTWEEQWLPKPKSTDPKGTQRTDALDFGFSVAIDERFLIVGSPRDSLTHLRQGTVFVFERNDSEQWQLRQQLADPKAAAGEQFGYRLALRDEWLLVTSYSTRIAEGETAPVGHVSVYQLSNDRGQPWQFHQKLQASPKELPGGLKLERYGYGIAVSANMLAISAPTTSQAGVNHHGIVFLYTLDQETGLWRPSTQVLPSIGASRFGCAVEFGKDFLAVGSIFFTPGGAERSHRAGAVFCFDLKAL